MTTLYRTIYADPPWPEHGGGKIKRGADRHYPLMTVKEIATLPVKSLAHPDAHLYLWVTNNFLPAGLQVMAAWGFRYVTMVTWVKEGNAGLGQYYRGKTEHCLFGVRGAVEYRTTAQGKRAQGQTLIEDVDGPFFEWTEPTAFKAARGRHSEKPAVMREMIERVSHAPRLELFARERVAGWGRWGNEVDSTVSLGSTPEQAALLAGI